MVVEAIRLLLFTREEAEMDRPVVAVFGPGNCQPGEKTYEKARELGSALAQAGYDVINGGYGGVMEASAKGVQESGLAEAKTIGVVMAHKPQGNRFLTETRIVADHFERLRILITEPDAYVFIVSQTSGTAEELISALNWRVKEAKRVSKPKRRPIIILYGDDNEWAELIMAVRTLTGLDLKSYADGVQKIESLELV